MKIINPVDLVVVDQLPRLEKRELIFLLLFTCNCVVSVWRGFLFLWVLGMGYVILLWHSLSLPFNYSAGINARYIIIGITIFHVLCVVQVWPNFFLMNVIFALKGSKLFYYHLLMRFSTITIVSG